MIFNTRPHARGIVLFEDAEGNKYSSRLKPYDAYRCLLAATATIHEDGKVEYKHLTQAENKTDDYRD